MSDIANTFKIMKPELKDMYSDAKKKSFPKLKEKMKKEPKKCSCEEKSKCSCKK